MSRYRSPTIAAVATQTEAQEYLSDVGRTTRSLATSAHDVLVSLGCSSYVKTIYIGYDIGGGAIAAELQWRRKKFFKRRAR